MIEVTSAPPSRSRREIAALPLLGSALLHLSIVALVLFNPPAREAQEASPGETASPAVSIPAYQPPTRPAVQEKAPEVPRKETPLGPDSKKPDEPPKEAGPERQVDPDLIDPSRQLAEAAPPKADPSPEPVPPTTAPPAEAAKARMIMGPADYAANTNWPRRTSPLAAAPPMADAGGATAADAASKVAAPLSANGRTGFDPGTGTNWRPSFKEAAGKCVTIPDLGRDAAGNPVLAVVQGRVFWPDHVTPMAGAHLQIVGTAFSTFSGNDGEYVLRFDPSLLQKCRIQYVQVRAQGFKGQLLTLSIGERVRSDDVVLRRQ